MAAGLKGNLLLLLVLLVQFCFLPEAGSTDKIHTPFYILSKLVTETELLPTQVESYSQGLSQEPASQ